MKIVWIRILGIGPWETFGKMKIKEVLTNKFQLVHRVPLFKGGTDWNA